MYYRGANAALLLYDITNSSTFEDVRGWLEGALAVYTLYGSHVHLAREHHPFLNIRSDSSLHAQNSKRTVHRI